MNNPVTFSSTGAHFRIADTEYQALNEVALRDEGAPLRELPIGRAAMVLRIILLAAAQDVIIQKEGSTVASTEMDGQEAATGALMQLFNPEIKHAVMDVGRVSVSVINDEEINDNNAVPILEFGVTSQAYKWASRVVEEHSAFLFSHNENTPVIPSGLLADMPERGEIALQFQGLLLNHETGLTNGDPDTHIEITRLRKPD